MGELQRLGAIFFCYSFFGCANADYIPDHIAAHMYAKKYYRIHNGVKRGELKEFEARYEELIKLHEQILRKLHIIDEQGHRLNDPENHHDNKASGKCQIITILKDKNISINFQNFKKLIVQAFDEDAPPEVAGDMRSFAEYLCINQLIFTFIFYFFALLDKDQATKLLHLFSKILATLEPEPVIKVLLACQEAINSDNTNLSVIPTNIKKSFEENIQSNSNVETVGYYLSLQNEIEQMDTQKLQVLVNKIIYTVFFLAKNKDEFHKIEHKLEKEHGYSTATQQDDEEDY